MEVFEIVKTVIEGAAFVYNAVQEVKSFKSRSKSLANRVDIVTKPVKELQKQVDAGKYKLPTDESVREAEEVMRLESPADGESRDIHGPLSYIRPLKELADCIKNVRGFLKNLSTMNCLEKFTNKTNITAQFNGFDNQLTILQQSLMLTLQVVFSEDMNDQFRSMKFDIMAMNKENQEALEEDLRNLRDSLKENNEIMEILTEHIHDLNLQLSKQFNQETPIGYREFSDFDKIEEGTFGPIYSAKHNNETKLVIKKYTDSSDPSVEVLKVQLGVWRKLATSRFVVQPYGYTMDDEGRMCFVLEYMHFGTLRNVLTDEEKHLLPWEKRLSLARDCAHGLYAIHYGVAKKTMLHRALTSTRFLVNSHYEAKIADNGFVMSQSKVLKSKARTKGDLEKDEMNYHVPEDTETLFKATLKSEIYKLGVIFYEIASRKKPFQSMEKDGKGFSDEEKIMFIWEGKMEEPPTDTPPAFRDLMDRCRAKSPSDRPPTCDVVSSLDKILGEI